MNLGTTADRASINDGGTYRMRRILLAILVPVAIIVGLLALALTFGGPADPTPMASVNDPFKQVDYSDLPALTHFVARDDQSLAYRVYSPAGVNTKGSIVLVHGSSGNGATMHVMARALSAAGYIVYVPDIRGHGESGAKGRIEYVGQLEEDLEDLYRAVELSQPVMLAGFSAGGGFVLRFAGSERQGLFSNYLLLAPFLGTDAPTYRPDSGGWVSVGIPRLVVIATLNAAGLRAFDNLPVINFALNEEAKEFLTPHYGFALALNFAPESDYEANIRAVAKPIEVVVGGGDEIFYADQFAGVFKAVGKDVPVTLIPGIGHVALTLEPKAIDTVVAVVNRIHESND